MEDCVACSRSGIRVCVQWRHGKVQELETNISISNMMWLRESLLRHLLDVKKVKIFGNILSHLLHTWDKENLTFCVRGCVVPFRVEELSLLTGLGVEGAEFDYE